MFAPTRRGFLLAVDLRAARLRHRTRWEDLNLSADRAGLGRRRGQRLAGLDHGDDAGAVGDARGKANTGDQRREDKRHYHHLQVGHAVGGKQREIVHDTLPIDVPVISRGEPAEGSCRWHPRRDHSRNLRSSALWQVPARRCPRRGGGGAWRPGRGRGRGRAISKWSRPVLVAGRLDPGPEGRWSLVAGLWTLVRGTASLDRNQS